MSLTAARWTLNRRRRTQDVRTRHAALLHRRRLDQNDRHIRIIVEVATCGLRRLSNDAVNVTSSLLMTPNDEFNTRLSHPPSLPPSFPPSLPPLSLPSIPMLFYDNLYSPPSGREKKKNNNNNLTKLNYYNIHVHSTISPRNQQNGVLQNTLSHRR